MSLIRPKLPLGGVLPPLASPGWPPAPPVIKCGSIRAEAIRAARHFIDTAARLADEQGRADLPGWDELPADNKALVIDAMSDTLAAIRRGDINGLTFPNALDSELA